MKKREVFSVQFSETGGTESIVAEYVGPVLRALKSSPGLHGAFEFWAKGAGFGSRERMQVVAAMCGGPVSAEAVVLLVRFCSEFKPAVGIAARVGGPSKAWAALKRKQARPQKVVTSEVEVRKLDVQEQLSEVMANVSAEDLKPGAVIVADRPAAVPPPESVPVVRKCVVCQVRVAKPREGKVTCSVVCERALEAGITREAQLELTRAENRAWRAPAVGTPAVESMDRPEKSAHTEVLPPGDRSPEAQGEGAPAVDVRAEWENAYGVELGAEKSDCGSRSADCGITPEAQGEAGQPVREPVVAPIEPGTVAKSRLELIREMAGRGR